MIIVFIPNCSEDYKMGTIKVLVNVDGYIHHEIDRICNFNVIYRTNIFFTVIGV